MITNSPTGGNKDSKPKVPSKGSLSSEGDNSDSVPRMQDQGGDDKRGRPRNKSTPTCFYCKK